MALEHDVNLSLISLSLEKILSSQIQKHQIICPDKFGLWKTPSVQLESGWRQIWYTFGMTWARRYRLSSQNGKQLKHPGTVFQRDLYMPLEAMVSAMMDAEIATFASLSSSFSSGAIIHVLGELVPGWNRVLLVYKGELVQPPKVKSWSLFFTKFLCFFRVNKTSVFPYGSRLPPQVSPGILLVLCQYSLLSRRPLLKFVIRQYSCLNIQEIDHAVASRGKMSQSFCWRHGTSSSLMLPATWVLVRSSTYHPTVCGSSSIILLATHQSYRLVV